MEVLKILGLCVVSAIVYGVLHDLITAHICVEYFTVLHPPTFRTTNPILLAVGWGIIASWWVGLIVSVPLCITSRLGSLPKLAARDLVRPMLILLGCMALLATLAGVLGYFTATPDARLAKKVPVERHVAVTVVGWMHTVSYVTGFLGGLALALVALAERWGRELATLRQKIESVEKHVAGSSSLPGA